MDTFHTRMSNQAASLASRPVSRSAGTYSIYVLHGGDSPEVTTRLNSFLSSHRITCMDESAQINYFYPNVDAQLHDWQVLADIDVLLIVATEGLAKCPWVAETLRVARALGRRMVALRPSQSALHSEGWTPMDCRVRDLADAEDRASVLESLLAHDSRTSQFLVGVDVLQLRQLQRELAAHGAHLRLDNDSLREVLLADLGGGGSQTRDAQLECSELLARYLGICAGLVEPLSMKSRPIEVELTRWGPLCTLTASSSSHREHA